MAHAQSSEFKDCIKISKVWEELGKKWLFSDTDYNILKPKVKRGYKFKQSVVV